MLTVLVAMVLVALTGSSMAQITGTQTPATDTYPIAYDETNRTFDFEQSVQGNGYFMTYLYAKAGYVALKNYAHGSGSLDSEATLTYQNKLIRNRDIYTDNTDFSQDCIQFKEDVSMVYAPMKIAVGNGYYAANPLDYSSLLKEKTWVKNYIAGTSMHHEVEYAHALDKELEIVGKDKVNKTWDPELKSVGYTQMKIVEDVTDGKAHIGVLQANQDFLVSPNKGAWKNPSIEIDEDYWGTYHIEKNMTLEVPYYVKQSSDNWLPCCFGGYSDRYPAGFMGLKSAKGVFDCTCFKAPTAAQFPRVY
jgi:hypothetical protein